MSLPRAVGWQYISTRGSFPWFWDLENANFKQSKGIVLEVCTQYITFTTKMEDSLLGCEAG